ncbi:MAG: glycerophosphodiester phosphodiesterase [Microbacteriaceae bacterium]|nr:glycerophosphodiester phosphodiesterase [Microbacteriaceae bacterium]
MKINSFAASYLSSSKPRLFAHRGFAVYSPENTLEAFKAALKSGADYIESDIQVTSDGEIVLCHDPDLASYGIENFMISEHTFAELQAIKIGESSGISSLREILEKLPNERFNLDLKTPLAITATVKIINDLNAKSRVLLASFQHSTLKQLRNLDPEIVTSASQKEVVLALLFHFTGLGSLMKRILKNAVALQIPVSFAGINLASKRWIKAVKKSGTEIHYWTINDPEKAKQLIELGADGIVTDRADLIYEMFQKTQLR